ncbi:hypothetical protein [Acinetobacter sp. ASP199]|uniref:hypothetical protein n=1 Tax=unclassified Acinetobacter TaxID=196816 RepID=UPI001F60A789|nr:hypothetical protein [Acinetobacter sp. ASP199]UNT59506.1 hypothetical protein IHE35_01320 [Acinetobacter sp. ASP199]
MKKSRILSASLLLITLPSVSPILWAGLEQSSDTSQTAEADHQEAEPSKGFSFLDYIPRLIDSTPTFLPEQSSEAIVPSINETEDSSWVDRRQKGVRHWTNRTANKIDHWFGEPDENEPARATLRVIVDNSWNKYDEYEVKPRIRGRIKLPTLERKLSVVFGDDSLDNELNDNVAITNENPGNAPDRRLDRSRTRENNSSLALRWSELSKKLPFETDLDLGVRSGDDIYVRVKASRDWALHNDFSFHAEQIYRYGIDSENYLRTNLELIHARPNQPFLSNQFSLIYADEQDDDLRWNNYSFRQHQFFNAHRFSYGLYTGGYMNDKDLRLNTWGPYTSWRQPFLREWFFVQTDVNYLNDHREDRSHYLGAAVRLEAIF